MRNSLVVGVLLISLGRGNVTVSTICMRRLSLSLLLRRSAHFFTSSSLAFSFSFLCSRRDCFPDILSESTPLTPSLSVQNTYTNADKLLEAAEQLAQTGECDPEEIYQAAHQLEDRIQDFVRRVEQRKVLLDMSVAFHTHVKEVGS